jgi:hypothetical protein
MKVSQPLIRSIEVQRAAIVSESIMAADVQKRMKIVGLFREGYSLIKGLLDNNILVEGRTFVKPKNCIISSVNGIT